MRKLIELLRRGATTRAQSTSQRAGDDPEPVIEAVMNRWEEALWELECDLDDMEADLSEFEDEHPPWEDLEQELSTGVYPKSGRAIPENRLVKKREDVRAMKQRHAELPALIEAAREQLREMQRKVDETPVHYTEPADESAGAFSAGFLFSGTIDDGPEIAPAPPPLPPVQQGRPATGAAPKQRKRAGLERFAVIDTETTGFSKHDRVVELAVVTVVDGETVDEYDTLIQPNRDPGPVHIHGITPEMLQAAPTFDQVLPDIATRVDGAVLVAHNISFDMRMLSQEVGRVDGASFSAGDGICTYKMTGSKLAVAARDAGLGSQEHTALGDARLVAGLLSLSGAWVGLPASCICASASAGGYTKRRPGSPPRGGSLHELALRSDWPAGIAEAEALYLDVLDRTLDDGLLEAWEAAWLADTANAVGISEQGRADLHAQYYDRLVERILADGIVTAEEASLSKMVADALSVEPRADTPTGQSELFAELEPGLKVCFTGKAAVGRPELEQMAVRASLEPVPSVTKKCGLLVAADPLTQSGKARTARKHGIPVIGADEFLHLVGKA